jgi:predicted nuclease of predicted toxin-antitoxin system
LLDCCVWGPAAAALKALGHDAIWAGNWPHDPGDEAILAIAHAESRILVTLDKDFGDLAVLRNRRHFGILRLVDVPARQQAPIALSAAASYAEILAAGGIVTAYPGRTRVRLGS